jgi:hypothetical protein
MISEKPEKLHKNDLIKFIIGILILILCFGSLIYYFSNYTFFHYNSQLNKVCRDYGYHKATDVKTIYISDYYMTSDNRVIEIECDNKVITNKNKALWDWNSKWFEIKTIGNEWCSNKDKWGDCNMWDNNYSTIIIH